MKPTIVFLEQQSWLGGAQRILEVVLESVSPEYEPIIAFPDRGPFSEQLEARGVETFILPVGRYRPGRKSLLELVGFAWRSLCCGLRLARLIRRRDIGLVYVNGPRCLLAGVLAAGLAGRPAIFHLHLILNRRLERALTAWLARWVSTILVCSKAAAAPLLEAEAGLSEKIRLVYNPTLSLRAARAPVRSVADRVTIGMVGRMTPHKGQHILLRAVGGLRPSLRDRVRILFVGEAAPRCATDLRYAAELRCEAARMGVADQVVWAGYRREPNYRSMDVLVHPSMGEALSLVVLEALAHGVPVIASRTGGIPELVQDGSNALLVPPGDERALSQALAAFLCDGELRARLRAGAESGPDHRFDLETFSLRVRGAIEELSPAPCVRPARHSFARSWRR